MKGNVGIIGPMICYSGVGARKTPGPVLDLMFQIGLSAARKGLRLRSGGADGADLAFEEGAASACLGAAWEVYIPWPGYNNIDASAEGFHVLKSSHVERNLTLLVESGAMSRSHRNSLSSGAAALHARNCHVVLGIDLASPSSFLVCWTPGGEDTGGTGTAIRLARHYEIPVYNLFSERDRQLLEVERNLP